MTADSQKPQYTDAERNAMRAYLQRSEVRISTMHRIATAFVGGAGLLLLVPVFLKDAIDSIISVLLQTMRVGFPSQDPVLALVLTILLYGLLAYFLVLSLATPLYALYLLLKDMVQFYFSIYAPGFPASLVHPTFSLSGITFSADESPQAKHEVMRYQYQEHHMNFMIPFSEGKRERYFDSIIEGTHGDIIPETRQWERLQAQKVIPEGVDRKTIERFDAAMGVARSIDRQLVEEVAHTEMLLVRNVIYLRRMVLRYAKALLMFIWTALVSFIMLPFLKDTRIPPQIILALGYFVWSLLVRPLVRLPIFWIYRHRQEKIDYSQVDAQLTLLERNILPYIQVAPFLAVFASVLAVWSLV